jgi:hypothetical protein
LTSAIHKLISPAAFLSFSETASGARLIEARHGDWIVDLIAPTSIVRLRDAWRHSTASLLAVGQADC